MLLAGDIGGTKTFLGIFDPLPARPKPVVVREFATLDYAELGAMLSQFFRAESVDEGKIDTACFGVAGPVVGDFAQLTNVPWHVDAHHIARRFGIRRAALLNDLQAMAYGVPVLTPPELHVLQEGEALRGGHMAVIAAGTGLGQAFLHNIDGRFVPSASEGGHADFAPRTEREVGLMQSLVERYGRAEVEHVISGPGLVNIYRFTHPDDSCTAVADLKAPDVPAAITRAARERTCPSCEEAFEIFIEAYGSEAGNLALRTVATGGVFVGGGIAPKVLPALTDARFIRAFREKAPFEAMLGRVPVKVIVNPQLGLLGAAVYAAGL